MFVALWLGLSLLLPVDVAMAQPLVMYGDERLPPYQFIEGGEPKGIDVDLWRAIGQKLGRPVEIRLTDWSKAQAEFREGRGDVLSSLGRTPEREAIYGFTQTIHRYNFSLFVRSARAADFEDSPLAGRRIGVTVGGFPRKHFEKNHPNVPLAIVANTEEGMRRVLRGDIDAFAANTWTGEYFLRELGIRGITPLPSPFVTVEGGMAVRRGDAALLADIERALTELKAEGRFDEIIDRWAGQRVHVFSQQEIWYIGLIAIGAMVSVSLAVLLLMARHRQRSLAREVARRHQKEEALAREQARLRSEIDKRILIENELRQVNAALEKANQELEGVSFAISHDLKGPLGRINSFSALLEQNYRDRLAGDGLLFLNFICQNSTRLMQLVDDLLSHARVTQQVQEPRPVDVVQLARAVLQEHASEIAEKEAVVKLELPPAEVLGDRHALVQAVGNLVENALKYSDPGRTPVIEIGGRASEGRYLLWVRDNGIGFDMAYHDKIFEIFRRLHAYNEYEGSGIGLALVKRAVERMNGKVWAESEPGKGASFFLDLPSEKTNFFVGT